MQSFVNKGDTLVSFVFRGEVPNISFEPGEVKAFDEEKYDFYTYYLPSLQVSSYVFPVSEETETANGEAEPETESTVEVGAMAPAPTPPPAPAPVVSTLEMEIAALEGKSKSELQDIAMRLELSTDGLKNEVKDRITNFLRR